VAVRNDEEQRYRVLEAEVNALRYELGLVLELLHTMVNDMHSPKVRWDRQLLPVWKQHIERKRNSQLTNT
jgi:hypothetical protein